MIQLSTLNMGCRFSRITAYERVKQANSNQTMRKHRGNSNQSTKLKSIRIKQRLNKNQCF
ncbi:hypothetical protein DAPPUDRAFT_309314 [Daphnia pulex]|uniref:Uncharacterized protein n=1 Tax=Daphnia pulex TaxID=6669 RepID=E9HC18_DAPPU|nr:hypothetical protein DAPPUDRAFT_309314 [Daphnia pulex]|eukprot:EFX70738.1 hypothetical protein DAPPUDRAFT_309314 [Daphnia pulex]